MATVRNTAEHLPGNRGSALIGVLLVLSILLVLGIGLLSQRARQYEAMRKAHLVAQARALAQAGLVDVRLKLLKDPTFPPMRPAGSSVFSYSEPLQDPTGEFTGIYSVNLDFARNDAKFRILRVTSTGLLGSPDQPLARYIIYGEVDVSRFSRQPGEEQEPNQERGSWSLLREGSKPVDILPN